MTQIELGTLYDINKELIKHEKPIDPIVFNLKIKDIAQHMQRNCDYLDIHYWMLLCHERRDYTVFNVIAAADVEDIEFELGPTLTNRGKILSIEERENEDCWEIWIRDDFSKENFVYYLFNYDEAVIEINK